MPDDDTPLDEPDERIAAILAVEPLDDVTRRRLVNTAIRSTGTARQARRLIAAAAIVFVLVAGAGIVVAVDGGNGSSPTAARDKVVALTPERGTTDFAIQTDARDLGDFGDLDITANLVRLRGALDTAGGNSASGASPAAGDATAANAPAKSDALIARLHALKCPSRALPAGSVVALASGTLDGHPVIVVDVKDSAGTQTVHAIETDTCAVHRLS